MPDVNDEFGAGLSDLGLVDVAPPSVLKKSGKGKKAEESAEQPAPTLDERIAAAVAEALKNAAKVKPVIDLEADEFVPPEGEEGAFIVIDDEAGRANYETVSVNGEVLQIKRNARVWVPRRFIKALETCRTVAIDQRFNRATGEYEDIERVYSAIPWRKA